MGRRMGGDTPKPLVKLLGKELVRRVYENVKSVKYVDNVTVVINPLYGDRVKKIIENANFVIQEKPLGTANALYTAVKDIDEDILVTYSDTPLIKPKTMENMIEFHKKEEADTTVLCGISKRMYPYALIEKDESGKISDIEEHAKPSSPPPWNYSIGAYVINSRLFKDVYSELPARSNGELYIPDAIKLLIKFGKNVLAFCIKDEDQYLGINTPQDLKKAEKVLGK